MRAAFNYTVKKLVDITNTSALLMHRDGERETDRPTERQEFSRSPKQIP